MSNKTGRILGIDYGKKRIGVAVSDPNGIIAQGLPTLVYKTPPDVLNKIARIISDYNVREVVVGLPLTLRGTVSTAAARTNRFIGELKNKTGLPVTVWDERFTSTIAENTLKAMGRSPSRNRRKIDEISAVLILQSYLDKVNLGLS